jgi:hypothetical protein
MMSKKITEEELIQLAKDNLEPGIITGGSCVDEEAQEKFDREQKGKPPKVAGDKSNKK